MNKLKKLVTHLIYLLILLLPVQTVYLIPRLIDGEKWQYGSLIIYAWEIVLWPTLFLGLVYLVQARKIQFKKIELNKFKVVVLSWLLVILTGLGIIWAGDQLLAAYAWLRLVEIMALMFLVLNLDLELIKIAKILTFVGAVEALLGSFQFVTQQVMACKWLGMAQHLPVELTSFVVDTGSHRWLRAYGTFAHPNILGGVLVVCLLAALWLYLIHKPGWTKVLAAASLPIIAIGLFFSFSRSAWLALMAGLIILVWQLRLENKIKHLIRPCLYLLVVGIMLCLVYWPLVNTRLTIKDRLEEKSVEQRLSYLDQAKLLSKRKMFQGTGLGNYTVELMSAYPRQAVWEYQPVHNIYLLALVELGIFGWLAWCLIIWIAIWQKHNRSISLAWLVSLLVIGFWDHYLWTQLVGLSLFWLVLAFNFREKFET